LECFYSNAKALAENVFHLYPEGKKKGLLLYVLELRRAFEETKGGFGHEVFNW
jgi:hypothetical protein